MSTQTTLESVTKYFEADHDTLDARFKRYQELKADDAGAAKQAFKAFLTGLTRHIVWEEEILFPVFEEKTGMTMGPTEVMRQEHRMIKGHLDAIHEKVRVGDPGTDANCAALLEVLAAHNRKEEMILYPAIDAQLDAAGLKSVAAAMDSVPEERYAVCCGGAGH